MSVVRPSSRDMAAQSIQHFRNRNFRTAAARGSNLGRYANHLLDQARQTLLSLLFTIIGVGQMGFTKPLTALTIDGQITAASITRPR